MDQVLADLTDRLHSKYEALLRQEPYFGTKPIPKFLDKGVYLFSECLFENALLV